MRSHCLRLLVAVAAAIFPLTLAVQEETTSAVNCRCHVGKSTTKIIGIACTIGPSESDPAVCNHAVRPFIPWGYRYIPSLGLYKLHALSKSYERAHAACAKEGAHLVIPQDENMAAALGRLFSPETRISFAYIGINDIASHGYYEADDGKMAPYLNWAPEEPNNVDGIEHCVNIAKDGKMNDVPCETISPFICERKLKATVPLGYHFLEGQGFYKIYKEKASFADAEDRCQGDGAHLAAPETQREGGALVQLVRAVNDLGDVWLGISDRDTEGRFLTVHGTPLEDLEFDNWDDKEPNDDFGNEDCVTFRHSGVINDDKCTDKKPFICELVVH